MTGLDADFRALADRLEAASGADRDIDGWILAYLKAGDPYIIGNHPGRFPQEPIYGERSDIMREVGGKDGAQYISAPAYTASIDAAVSLVPEGRRWGLDTFDGKATAIVATIEEGTGYYIGDEETGIASTPALALTAACLRALSSLEKDPK